MSGGSRSLAGRRVLVTGGARGIGAALARRLHQRGARVVVVGLEPELLADVSATCGDAPWSSCDVRSRAQVDAAVEMAVDRLGGLDVVVANAGIAAQLPLVGGDPDVFERTNAVNVLGTYYTLRAAAPHLSHPNGYALVIASLAAAVHAPLLGAYSASKAAVEALGNTLRVELRPSGARAGVAYFAELDTDMTSRGFGTRAATALLHGSRLHRVASLEVGVAALERGIARRSRRIVAPGWVWPVLPLRMAVQPLLDRRFQRGLVDALRIARTERPPLTTPQPDGQP
ncbi:SDR family NAD(P)-dependent oxidoreductase [Micromonospora sp. CPCC 205546]|uniref:SDR family NAD(P)-dependent oxidoreductase n=1 Tax=Micromonospora sp. CPCC 205546 TaxID=3122397 RepID=UPI002FF2CCF1